MTIINSQFTQKNSQVARQNGPKFNVVEQVDSISVSGEKVPKS